MSFLSKKHLVAAPVAAILVAAAANPAAAVEITGDSHTIIAYDLPDSAYAWQIRGPSDSLLKSRSAEISSTSALPDGLYQYQVMGYMTPTKRSAAKAAMNNGRNGAQPSSVGKGVIKSGYFRLHEGSVINKQDEI